MSKAIEEAEALGILMADMVENAGEETGYDVPRSKQPKFTPDEALIKGYLKHNLHVRRTLDQFYYSMLDTSKRDGDQVVYRHAKYTSKRDGDQVVYRHVIFERALDSKIKILMVDQLWLWVINGR